MPVNIATTSQLTIGGMKNSVTSLMGSVSYLKAFIPVAAHNIIGNRVNYDPSYFKTHMLKETPYKTFSKKVPKKHDLYVLYDWLKSALEGIQKKYLKQLFLIVRDKHTKDVIEFYCFSIQYIQEDKSLIAPKHWETVYDSTAKILQSINLLSELKMLDSANVTYAIQVDLNESAPKSYIIPNFDRGTPFVETEDKDTYSMGSISTGRHKLRVHAKGSAFNVKEEGEIEEKEELSQSLSEDLDANTPKITVLENRCFNSHSNEGVEQFGDLQEINIMINAASPEKDIKANTDGIIEETTIVPLSTKRTKNVHQKGNKLAQNIDIETNINGIIEEASIEPPFTKRTRNGHQKAVNMDMANIEGSEAESEEFIEPPKEKKKRIVKKIRNTTKGEVFEALKEKERNKITQDAEVVDKENFYESEAEIKTFAKASNKRKKNVILDKPNNSTKNMDIKEIEVGNEVVPEAPSKKKRKVARGKANKLLQKMNAENTNVEDVNGNCVELPKQRKRKINNKSANIQKDSDVMKDVINENNEINGNQNNMEDNEKTCDNFIKDLIEVEEIVDTQKSEETNKESDNFIDDMTEVQNIKCLCGLTNVVDGVDLIVCDNCGNFEHCVCVGYKSISDMPKPHICYPCHILTGKRLTDVRMTVHKNQMERQMFAVLRLVSYYCFTVQNTPAFIFDQLKDSDIFCNNMLKFNFISKKDGQYSCIIENIRKLLEGPSFYKSVKTFSIASSPISI